MGFVKKVFWVGVGAAIGWVWGFLSLKALVRRTRSKFAPATLAETAADAGGRLSRRVGDAVKSGVEDARRKEIELRESLDYQRRRAG
ncbi:MAG: hypothetical protein DCC49_04350 [Acidobacteria bacterium]|nr:MAG: hypothetical protein DCC49_04350 [Acidobacteriota bacterium]